MDKETVKRKRMNRATRVEAVHRIDVRKILKRPARRA